MMPVGFLMKEHRLIERMIKLIRLMLQDIDKGKRFDPPFIDVAADFMRTYADRCHHGKEEDILFSALEKKKMSEEHRRIMDRLIEEHKLSRSTLKKLVQAKDKYVCGDKGALKEVSAHLKTIVELYPQHIENEDKHFFIPCMTYFAPEEKSKMIGQMREFDMKMIHEKYASVLECYEKQARPERIQ